MVARRAQLGALAALGTLLLLLLARRPAPPLTAPHTRPVLPSSTTPPPQTNITTSINSVNSLRITDTSSVSIPSRNSSSQTPVNRTSSEIPKKEEKTQLNKSNQVVLTKDVYVAGHETPHPELCPGLGEDLKVLILVSSAPSHRLARDAVRLTWGHYAARKDISLAFVLGTPAGEALSTALTEEDNLYGDIIIGRSLDSYSNLTLKSLSMLEWVDTYCPRVPKILKTDDDMFINVPKLLKFMESNGRANASKTIWGKVLKKSLPKRAPTSKYYLSSLQFPNKTLPDFATGPAYLITSDAVSLLLKAAPHEPYIRLEDVFITGILAGKLGLKRVHAGEFYNKRVALHPCTIQRGIAIHMVRYHEQFDLWRKLLDGEFHINVRNCTEWHDSEDDEKASSDTTKKPLKEMRWKNNYQDRHLSTLHTSNSRNNTKIKENRLYNLFLSHFLIKKDLVQIK